MSNVDPLWRVRDRELQEKRLRPFFLKRGAGVHSRLDDLYSGRISEGEGASADLDRSRSAALMSSSETTSHVSPKAFWKRQIPISFHQCFPPLDKCHGRKAFHGAPPLLHKQPRAPGASSICCASARDFASLPGETSMKTRSLVGRCCDLLVSR